MLGGRCQICGFDVFQGALEFHHESPLQKDFQVSSGTTRSIERDLSEIKKCFLLCSNCHKCVHAGVYKTPEQHVYRDDVAQNIIDRINQQKAKIEHRCIDCGKTISSASGRCLECSYKTRRKTIRPDRDGLKNLIRNNSFTQIGKEYNVSVSSVKKWCKKYDLPYRKDEIRNYTDEQWKII